MMINVPILGGGAIDAHINCCLLEKETVQKLLGGFFLLRGVKYVSLGWVGLEFQFFLKMTCLGVIYHIQKDS